VTEAGRYRHDPRKSVLFPGSRDPQGIDWNAEPVVVAHRRMIYSNKTLGRDIAVPVSATPAIVGGVGAVVASDDGFVRFFGRGLSTMFWERRVSASVYASIVVDHAREHVIVCATTGVVTAFDLHGAKMWAANLEHPVCATPAVDEARDLLVVATFRHRVAALALGTGEMIFNVAVPEPWDAGLGGVASYRDPYSSPVCCGDDGSVVAAAGDVLLRIAADGSILWKATLDGAVKSSPCLISQTGEVAACTVAGTCWFVDVAAGDVRGRIETGAKIVASPAVSGPVMAIGLITDRAVGVDVIARRVIWTSSLGGPREYTSWTTLPDGSFAATTGRGNVLCLAAPDGAFRWETSQVLGLPNHKPRMDITPIAGPDGVLYCASYAGDLYEFCFRPQQEKP
jgi:outer membrane protein assembly factor BamB